MVDILASDEDRRLIGLLMDSKDGWLALSDRVCRNLGVDFCDCTQDDDYAQDFLLHDGDSLRIDNVGAGGRYQAVLTRDGMAFIAYGHTTALATCAAAVKARSYERAIMRALNPSMPARVRDPMAELRVRRRAA